MILKHPEDVPAEEVIMEGASKVRKQGLIMKEDGAPGFAMRLFEMEPGGHTPFHTHEWEHVNYILEGEGTLALEDRQVPIKAGDSILVPPGEKHNYRNTGDSIMKFLCMVPKEYG
jgi:quercetin dioxygenase-like cupin family protein